MAKRGMVPWAGLAAGPAAWAINTQLSYALLPWTCAHGFNVIAPAAVFLLSVAISGALLSRRAWLTLPSHGSVDATDSHQPHKMVAGIGVALGTLFALVILMQGAASLVLSGCVR